MEIKSFNVSNLRVTIHHDEHAESPRTMHDNAGVMACSHRRYDLGEDKLDTRRFDGWREVEQHLMAEHNPIVIMPLYLMDHSGLSISTEPFGCRWDSGQVGFIYMTPERFKKWWGKDTVAAMTEEQRIEAATKCLLAEVAEYDAYLQGEVYGFTVEAPKPCGSCGHTEWEEVGSCWGFIGLQSVEEAARAEAAAHVRHVAQKATQTAQEAV